MKKIVIIVAGGKGTRMGAEIPKQFLLLNGKPVLMHSIEAFHNYDPDIKILLVIPTAYRMHWKTLCEKYNFDVAHYIVQGGETRFESVRNALEFVDKHSLVAVHDGVRPLVSRQIIADTFEAAEERKAACPAIQISDTLRIKTKDSTRFVDRNNYYMVQTPQIFVGRILQSAYKQDYSPDFTDDVSVVENYRRCRPMIVNGSPENIKITTPTDLLVAEAILKTRCSI